MSHKFIFLCATMCISFAASAEPNCLYDTSAKKSNAISYNERYEGVPARLKYKLSQPWDHYCPKCTLEDKTRCKQLTCQSANIKIDDLYAGVEVETNKWIRLANQTALKGAKDGGGAFGAVAVQIDDTTGKIIRYWKDYNHVKLCHDPSAHAELFTIREVSKELGVQDLGHIDKAASKLYQPNKSSHIEFYSSAEPCPMCMSAIYWAKIPVLVFAATRYDVTQFVRRNGATLSDELLYKEIRRPYRQRTLIKAYQATTDNSLDVFNWWQKNK